MINLPLPLLLSVFAELEDATNLLPPIIKMPPTTVRPEIAFVTDIRGECSAGTTSILPQVVGSNCCVARVDPMY